MGRAAFFGAPLESDKREAFAAEFADTNRRRALVILPLMAIAHAIHLVVFRVSPTERAVLVPRIVQWRDGLAAAHGVTMVVVAGLALAVWRYGRTRAARFIGRAAAATYLVHGAVVAGIDQLSVTSVTPFVAYCLAEAVIACLTPPEALLVYALGLSTFVPAILMMQPSASARLAALPSGITIVVVSVALSWMLHLARRRDFAQRVTIEAQRRGVTDRADVYAVGVIVFLLLTGRLPFEDTTARGILLASMLRDAPDVRSVVPDLSPALSRLVARCLEKNPLSRPPALDLARKLAEFAEGEGVAAVEVLEREGMIHPAGSSIHMQETLVEIMRRQPA